MIEQMDKPENRISEVVIGASIEVHRHLGPALLESAYAACLADELASRGVRFRREVPIAVRYKGRTLQDAFRADLLVDELVLIELKAVAEITPVHRAQALTYLHLSGLKLCLMLNFKVVCMREGIDRFVNKL
jgi:GxxExxY protein